MMRVLTRPCMCVFQGKSNLISAAKTVGEASQDVMAGIGETADDMDKMYQVCARLDLPLCIHVSTRILEF